MEHTVTRIIPRELSTIGEWSIDGKFACYTLEDTYRQPKDWIPGQPLSWKIPRFTAIPTGLYKLIIDWSPHFNAYLPHILDVPGYTGVRVHSGNGPGDTDGCILVGNRRSTDTILDSREAFKELFYKIAHGGANQWLRIQ